ncbi:hypothetical protein [Pedobacter sp.]|uniref:hypothetical protein n=1 Tax=Pedobacter sp. TaxID=1411316 RepID=UPI003BAABA5C
MAENLPNWINYVFLIIVGLTLLFFYISNGKPFKLIIFLSVLSIVQLVLAFNGFYKITDTFPPRLIFIFAPNIVLLIFGLLPKQLEYVFKHRNLKVSTFLHTIRFFIEIILYQLFINKLIPELMTFTGRNFDIFAGLTAPIIAFLITKKKIGNKALILWNFICLGLVLFILINGVLSSQTPFQQFGFEQPNVAILYFPFILLPSTIVPLVVYTHITDLLFLIKKTKHEEHFSTLGN